MSNQNVSLNVSAKTVDEAIAQGLSQLKRTRDQVDVEIINEGKRGLFGLGAEEATVRITVKTQPSSPEATPPDAVDSAVDKLDSAAEADESAAETVEGDEAAANDDGGDDDDFGDEPLESDTVAIAKEHLENLLKNMGIQAQVVARLAPDLVEGDETPPTVLDIQGKDLGILIGRRSETLQALQYLVRLMVSKQMGSWQRVVVDVESYRSRRRQSLQKMARRMAERAINNRERVVLEAMTAYERRIIHLTLRDHPAVFTKSIGHDNNRKVTIIPK
jgi:spoIIIJ-associated protein